MDFQNKTLKHSKLVKDLLTENVNSIIIIDHTNFKIDKHLDRAKRAYVLECKYRDKSLNQDKQGVALTGRNSAGPLCNVGRPTAHAPGGRPARPPAAL